MTKNISIIVLILLGSLVFANGEPFDVTERKEVGFLENRCEDSFIYAALYQFDYNFKSHYENKTKSTIRSDIALELFPDRINFYWDDLSESQQQRINRYCEVDKVIKSITPMESDIEIGYVEIIYEMPKMKFIIDRYLPAWQSYIYLKEGIDQRPYYDLIYYLTFLDEEAFEAFIIDYQELNEKINALNIYGGAKNDQN